MARQPQEHDAPLFSPGGTQAAAAQASARASGGWRQRILARLSVAPSTIWELAEYFEVSDNRISGRVSDLSREFYIELAGEQRTHPKTGCPGEVWRVARAQPGNAEPAERLVNQTYPLTVRIGEDLFDRQQLLPREGYPGIPYARRADNGGQRQLVRVSMIECDCGAPLDFFKDGDIKKFRCRRAECSATWRLQTINEPGRAPMLALVAEEF